MPKCKAFTKEGKACQAQAQIGREYCFIHDPEKVEEVKTAQSRGGTSIKTIDPNQYRPWRGSRGDVTVLRSPRPQDVVNLLADTIDEVKTGQIDPRVANAVGYLAGILVKALEVEAIDDRLTAIENAIGVDKL